MLLVHNISCSFVFVRIVFSNIYKGVKDSIVQCILSFDTEGEKFDERKRNALKLFEVEGKTVNVKSFKIPNLINRIVYKILRSSKAQRSFEYAHKLLQNDVLTPRPIAYAEQTGLLFSRSFYVSEHLDYDLTYRELCHNSPYDGNEEILAAFARFTYTLHQKGIHFLDHSMGNTLIVIKEDGYDFYLVDLNRMRFGEMDFTTRIANFARLSPRTKDIEVMAKAYAAVSGESLDKVYNEMHKGITAFRKKSQNKKRLKRQLKFWK